MADGADLDLTELTRRRSALGELADRQAELLVERDRQAAELEGLQRRGDEVATVEEARRRLAELDRRRADLGRQRGALLDGIDEVAGGLVADVDPAPAIESLDGSVPVALLPVRVEARFDDGATARSSTTRRRRVRRW